MTEELATRLEDLVRSIAQAEIAEREALLIKLEKLVFDLEARGQDVPREARAHVRPECDDGIEDRFDNMPV
ncbi:hypothetical protein [Salipiger sp.]|uniref:hypothetical protein n=1 Tax=Salipiger sp. TaxID=2078585 RepID=UPI003A985349